MTPEDFIAALDERLERFEEAFRAAGVLVRKRGTVIAGAAETARRVGCSRATVFRIGKAHESARMVGLRPLKRGRYNVEEVRRLLEVKPNAQDKYLSKPRISK